MREVETTVNNVETTVNNSVNWKPTAEEAKALALHYKRRGYPFVFAYMLIFGRKPTKLFRSEGH